MTGEQPQLRRSLGLFDVALFFIVAGSNLQWVATAAAAGPSSVVVWLIGLAAMFVPLSIVVVYLSAHYPEEGGMYVWAKRAFGPFAGFFTGWTYWTSNLPYFPALLYFAAGNALFIDPRVHDAFNGSAPYFIIFALCGLGLATLLNVLGLEVGKWLNNAGGAARWIATVALIAIGGVMWWRFGFATPVNAHTLTPGVALKDVIFWSVIAFAWTGPESIPFMAGEIQHPRRTIPRALLIAAPAIAAIYIVGTLAVLAVLAPNVVDPSSGVMEAIANAASRMSWSFVTPAVAVMVVISCLGSCGAWLGSVARLPFVAGIDKFLPEAFGRMHPRWGSPVAALLTQSIVAAVFIFLGQAGSSVKTAYSTLVNSTVVITMIPFLLLFASAYKLYVPSVPGDAIRVPGGRATIFLAATVGIITTAVALVLGLFPPDDEPNKPLAVARVIALTALMAGAGIAVYFTGRRRA